MALFTLFLASSSLLLQARAHGLVSSISFDGVEYPAWDPYSSQNANPIVGSIERKIDNNGPIDYSTAIIATGEGTNAKQYDPVSPVLTADVNAGAQVLITWNTWPSSHKGPIMNYMASCGQSDCTGVVGSDLEWFKISQETFDNATSLWPTETLASTLKYTLTLPTDLAAGAYLLRHELLAMHTIGDPQFYPRAFQINLKSSGSLTPTGAKFPDQYAANSVDYKTWNIYNDNNSNFVPPGIAVYSGGSTAPAASSSAAETVVASSTPVTPSTASSHGTVASSSVAAVPSVASSVVASASSPATTAISGASTSSAAVAVPTQPSVTPISASASAPFASAPAASATKPVRVCNKQRRPRSRIMRNIDWDI